MVMYKYGVIITSIMLLFVGCSKQISVTKKVRQNQTKLMFLDEYVYPAKQELKSTVIGGVSGVDFYKNVYYIVVDDPQTPRAYKAKINIENYKIDTIVFSDVILFDKTKHTFFANNHLDLESIVVHNNQLVISSEGSIKNGKNPFIFKSDIKGNFKVALQLPKKFLANSFEKPRNNAVFEGLTQSYDYKGYWSATEFPLEADGTPPKYKTTKSPVRFTYFDANSNKAVKEFAYELEPLSRPINGISLNGLTDILEYKKNHFLVLERTYQSGYIGNENLVRIYKAVIHKTATNTLDISSLIKTNYVPLQKELLFDFSTIQSKLTSKTIDNIEGITFGPILPNGNKSLILVADDNFQVYGKQLNQFFLFEIIE